PVYFHFGSKAENAVQHTMSALGQKRTLTRGAGTKYFCGGRIKKKNEPPTGVDRLLFFPQKKKVCGFFKKNWDHRDKSLIPKIFHHYFTFRGSLGPELVGHEQFAGYVDRVTNVFGQYTTDILAMIEEGNRVSGKMRFRGYHQQKTFGVAPSGRHVWWIGMPIFTFDGPKV